MPSERATDAVDALVQRLLAPLDVADVAVLEYEDVLRLLKAGQKIDYPSGLTSTRQARATLKEARTEMRGEIANKIRRLFAANNTLLEQAESMNSRLAAIVRERAQITPEQWAAIESNATEGAAALREQRHIIEGLQKTS